MHLETGFHGECVHLYVGVVALLAQTRSLGDQGGGLAHLSEAKMDERLDEGGMGYCELESMRAYVGKCSVGGL
jgi:hypothetical protein